MSGNGGRGLTRTAVFLFFFLFALFALFALFVKLS